MKRNKYLQPKHDDPHEIFMVQCHVFQIHPIVYHPHFPALFQSDHLQFHPSQLQEFLHHQLHQSLTFLHFLTHFVHFHHQVFHLFHDHLFLLCPLHPAFALSHFHLPFQFFQYLWVSQVFQFHLSEFQIFLVPLSGNPDQFLVLSVSLNFRLLVALLIQFLLEILIFQYHVFHYQVVH